MFFGIPGSGAQSLEFHKNEKYYFFIPVSISALNYTNKQLIYYTLKRKFTVIKKAVQLFSVESYKEGWDDEDKKGMRHNLV